MYIDSHCHLNRLDLSSYQGRLADVLEEARHKGVKGFLCVSVSLEEHSDLLKIAKETKNIWVSVGLHPTEAPRQPVSQEQLLSLASHPKVIAIGETGLDYYRVTSDEEWQKERFMTHIRVAQLCQKPLIVHTRSAVAETIACLKSSKGDGVIHCFTEDWDAAKQFLDLGFYISFSGIVTFKNAKAIQEVARRMPIERMLIETDSPYLAPVPYRGKPNVPGFVPLVAECIASLREVSPEWIGEKTTENFLKLFAISFE